VFPLTIEVKGVCQVCRNLLQEEKEVFWKKCNVCGGGMYKKENCKKCGGRGYKDREWKCEGKCVCGTEYCGGHITKENCKTCNKY
jgi:hypothetical protein